jgi:hypothetical protein
MDCIQERTGRQGKMFILTTLSTPQRFHQPDMPFPVFTPHRLSFDSQRFGLTPTKDSSMTQRLLKRKVLCCDSGERGIMQDFMIS